MKGIALHGTVAHKNHEDDDIQQQGLMKDLVQLTKPGITVANLMATFSGLWVASHGRPNLIILLLTLIGTGLVIASGATLNNYVDRDIDHRMTRTSERVLASGRVTPQLAFNFGITLGVLGLAILAFLVNLTAAFCALAGLIFYAYIYTVWLKRTTSLNTVLGGISGAMPPLIGWAAGSGGTIGFGGWVIFCIFFLWQPPHFLPLAMKRCEEYRAAGIPMLPVVRGFTETKRQILRWSAALVPVSLLPVMLGYENIFYFVCTLVLGLIFLWRALQGLYTKDDLAWASKLFSYSLIYLTAMCVIMVVGAM